MIEFPILALLKDDVDFVIMRGTTRKEGFDARLDHA